MNKNYLLIKAVFDFVQVQIVNTHNNGLPDIKVKKKVMHKTPLSISTFQERH